MLALEDSHALLLEHAEYEHILENGFDGELNIKVGLLRQAAVLQVLSWTPDSDVWFLLVCASHADADQHACFCTKRHACC